MSMRPPPSTGARASSVSSRAPAAFPSVTRPRSRPSETVHLHRPWRARPAPLPKENPMRDLAIRLENCPGALARMGEALGEAGVSIEGGGAFAVDGSGIAHFLVA